MGIWLVAPAPLPTLACMVHGVERLLCGIGNPRGPSAIQAANYQAILRSSRQTVTIQPRSMIAEGQCWQGPVVREKRAFAQGHYTTRIGFVGSELGQNQLVLMYRHRSCGEEWQNIEEPVWFDRTSCNYGGDRLWFLCPHRGRLVTVLYGAGVRFLCRRCYGLPYGSQDETYMDRMMRKARTIRLRLRAV